MAFLEDLKGFYGTGEKNRAGQSLEEFLDRYDPRKYDCPSCTTDIVAVQCDEPLRSWGQPLKLLLVKRGNHPSIGWYATPGGFVELKEDLYEGAARELQEETGVTGLPLQQLRTWGAYDRDPRWRVITTSFLALAEGNLPVRAGDDAADALWMDVSLRLVSEEDGQQRKEIWELCLDHEERKVHVAARVERTYFPDAVLPRERYRLLWADGLAVDHGCIITQALLYLKERLEERTGGKTVR